MLFRNNYGVDLGSSSVKVYSFFRNKSYIEKNMVAYRGRRILAIGNEAYEMFEKSPADIYEQHRVTEMIYKGLATLSEKQRQRIYAHYFLGMSQTEIARVENCSKISVHQSINRGLKQLQEYFLKNNL